ncbi:MAG TPA: ankyrin repeat domain-containing protein [Xanthobacteraceae bacterium]|nr:ankyrin repeat domain-containing protein [Xanthobacteraceae bacterium]
MTHDPSPSARRTRTLPARPSLEHLKNEAKQRLKSLRRQEPQARLAAVQLALAREYGFASWRQLKTHVDRSDPAQLDRKRVFDAAHAGDVETVRRAFAAGFDPGTTDADGRTIHQIAKADRHEAIEILARDVQGGATRPAQVEQELGAILDAANQGRVDELRRLLDAHPDLIDARGGDFQKQAALHKAACGNRHACVRLLLERGADIHVRDFPDNASALHLAAAVADLEMVRMLVEAGSDVDGRGDDYEVGVLGWATCFRRVREDVAAYLLSQGAKLDLWSAIALDRADDVRRLITGDPALLNARMTRNQHRRTPLHHAAAKNRPAMVRLLLDLGADPRAADATGATALTTAAQENADANIVSMLEVAGAELDFIAALNLKRYDLAAAMLKEDPSRIGPNGRDTIVLHLSVSKRNVESVRWLIEHGIDVNAKRPMWDCNHTALHMTAENGALDLSRMLLDAGADPNIRDDKYGATALGWANFFSREELATLVREKGGSK